MCTGKKTVFDCGCRSSDTLFAGLTQENMRELWSLCCSVLVCARADTTFFSEYWSIMCSEEDDRRMTSSTQHTQEIGCISHTCTYTHTHNGLQFLSRLSGAPFVVDVH